ncbi:GntR family transcriptional regulator [Salipaludibacillus keqinensis]|jgi:GntR family transcriptional regulator|uniref:GntR family transcriptional regulator n=1 Tax=Salipaludibacillus keqinensis TaxID=2045207 RepID=A0A323TCD5_9BACI|nr:GntR family transcriptional regulator [Salipaludibacillus keqinensis]PYZ92430.1 GntR family transcriptional regulator [Salipaludibacillus keqinensis]
MKSQLDDDKPIFQQICVMIEEDILDNQIHEEEKIPSTNELAKFYRINPATAAKGIQTLVDKEIIYKRRGIGMFVQKGAKEKLIEERKQTFMKNYVEPLLHEAKRLRVGKEEIISYMEREDDQ